MPVPPTQPDPKEAVEAQLCAYLEDELSPAERAVIEQHLAVHPQHRQLLADLALNRGWLRDVKHEAAPAEVGEAFRQQVERSLLMGEDRPAAGRSGGRWRQFGVLAALLLMTAGLGVVLTVMLAAPSRPTNSVAIDAPTSPMSPPATTAPAADRTVLTRSMSSAVIAPPPPVPTMTVEPDRPTTSLAEAAPPTTATRSAVPTLRAPGAMAGGQFGGLPAAVAAAPQTVHLQVATADPASLGRFLTRRGLTLDEPRADGQPAAGDKRYAAAANQQQSNAQSTRRPDGFLSGVAAPDGIADVSRRYVGRELTDAQVRQLAADLTAAAAPGRVTAAADSVIAATRGPRLTLARGDRVTVVIPQLTGAGLEPTNAVRVADDGTITLPMVDAVAAAGATPDEVARRVADRYRGAHLIANPTVTVSSDGAPTDTLVVDVEPTPAKPR